MSGSRNEHEGDRSFEETLGQPGKHFFTESLKRLSTSTVPVVAQSAQLALEVGHIPDAKTALNADDSDKLPTNFFVRFNLERSSLASGLTVSADVIKRLNTAATDEEVDTIIEELLPDMARTVVIYAAYLNSSLPADQRRSTIPLYSQSPSALYEQAIEAQLQFFAEREAAGKPVGQQYLDPRLGNLSLSDRSALFMQDALAHNEPLRTLNVGMDEFRDLVFEFLTNPAAKITQKQRQFLENIAVQFETLHERALEAVTSPDTQLTPEQDALLRQLIARFENGDRTDRTDNIELAYVMQRELITQTLATLVGKAVDRYIQQQIQNQLGIIQTQLGRLSIEEQMQLKKLMREQYELRREKTYRDSLQTTLAQPQYVARNVIENLITQFVKE